MRKLLTVSLLGALMSMPSAVLAQASWYGSIRTGIESDDSNNTGVADFDSRWGIQGSSEVSEGLTAVYRYERSIDSSDASEPDGRLSYVGLSGGFGTVTVGQIWGAAYNHFGAIVDQALKYGSPGETGYRDGNAVSYSVSVGNISLQADVIMDQSTGETGDGFAFGATLGGLMETGSVAIAHRNTDEDSKADPNDDSTAMTEMSSGFVAGNYGIGDMTVFLGYSRDSFEDASCTLQAAVNNFRNCYYELKQNTIFAGVHGEVEDTGVNYAFTMRSAKRTNSGFGLRNINNTQIFVLVFDSVKSTPWTLGLSRSLGGGASVNFEHSEPDDDDRDSNSAVWLQVDF